MERFTLNGRVYQAKEIDFNYICMLEVEGIEFQKMGKGFLNMIKIYVAYCMDADPEVAGEEINQHIKNGGKLSEITDVLSEKIETSDFFRAMAETTDSEEVTETPRKGRPKKEKEVSE